MKASQLVHSAELERDRKLPVIEHLGGAYCANACPLQRLNVAICAEEERFYYVRANRSFRDNKTTCGGAAYQAIS